MLLNCANFEGFWVEQFSLSDIRKLNLFQLDYRGKFVCHQASTQIRTFNMLLMMMLMTIIICKFTYPPSTKHHIQMQEYKNTNSLSCCLDVLFLIEKNWWNMRIFCISFALCMHLASSYVYDIHCFKRRYMDGVHRTPHHRSTQLVCFHSNVCRQAGSYTVTYTACVYEKRLRPSA